MRTLAFVMFAVTIGFASDSLAQNCGLDPAVPPGSQTEQEMVYYLITRGATSVMHGKDGFVHFEYNVTGGPSGSEFEIVAAADTWNASSWNGQGQTNFLFYNDGSTTGKVKKDFHNVVCFDYYTDPLDGSQPVKDLLSAKSLATS
ncbi:hypothetical protein HYR99_30615 [Candidatus Poribacteria bacterium]|nr:hypothetical protein [Candidatus Poribacteria bacterium]